MFRFLLDKIKEHRTLHRYINTAQHFGEELKDFTEYFTTLGFKKLFKIRQISQTEFDLIIACNGVISDLYILVNSYLQLKFRSHPLQDDQILQIQGDIRKKMQLIKTLDSNSIENPLNPFEYDRSFDNARCAEDFVKSLCDGHGDYRPPRPYQDYRYDNRAIAFSQEMLNKLNAFKNIEEFTKHLYEMSYGAAFALNIVQTEIQPQYYDLIILCNCY